MIYLLDTNAFADLMRELPSAIAQIEHLTAVDENDLWIAATAMSLGASLVSRDNDVRNIDGLAIVDWSN